MVEELNQEQFQEKVIFADGKVMVEFYEKDDEHCFDEEAVVERLEEIEAGSIPVFKVDIKKQPLLGQTYASHGVPCFALFDKGQYKEFRTGEQPLEVLEEMLS
ncbi:MAG: thioredoxin family protein [Eggerthellaceae bacterium]|nr:thioredoxin family protein [Eggerthellaceae bacterium]